jgi:serine/threonine protein kinase
MKDKIGYFYDESVILSSDFFEFLKKNISSGSFYVDDQLQSRIQELLDVGRFLDSYELTCFIGVSKKYKNIFNIQTKNLFEFKQLEKLVDEFDTFYFVTQNDALLRRIPKELIKKKHFKAAKIYNGKLSFYELNNEEQKTFKLAYYLDKDPYLKAISDKKINVVYSPKIGYLPLGKKDIYSGGEGNLYPSFNGWLVKIYNDRHQNYPNLKKLQKMLEMDVFDDRIIWPKDIVYFQGQFVGYVMKKIENATPLSDMFNTRVLPFPNKPYYRVTTLLNILQAIQYLHQKNILLGDLKDDNILIRNEEEIFIVDSGSFQIEDYASNVLTKGWVDNNLNKSFDARKNLRKLEDEYYPINRLAFELLTSKNPHFDPNNTELNIDNLEGFHFPLTPGKKVDKNLIFWAVLSQRLRDYLYYYFIDSSNRKITYLEELIVELSKEKMRFSKYK